MTVVEKIVALRAAMEAERADGVYVPSSDPHMTEYLPARWRCRAWLSGFTGSAGTLCVTREAAALWAAGGPALLDLSRWRRGGRCRF